MGNSVVAGRVGLALEAPQAVVAGLLGKLAPLPKAAAAEHTQARVQGLRETQRREAGNPLGVRSIATGT